MNEYDLDMKDLHFFAEFLHRTFGCEDAVVRDYATGTLVSVNFNGKGSNLKDDEYNRMFDLAIRAKTQADYFKNQEYFLKWGFFLIAQEGQRLYFEKLDSFTFEGKEYTSCSEVLKSYGIDPMQFYETYDGDTSILDTVFKLIISSKIRKVGDVNGSFVFQN